MENNLNDSQLFWDSLLDVLKNPWKKPTYIQEPINGEDTFGLYFNRLFFPYCLIVWYLCKTKVHFLRYVLENEDVIPASLFVQSPRLTSNELFEAFSVLELDNATLLLDRIDCPISVFTELKEALDAGEEARFASAIDGLDLLEITPFLKLVRFVIKKMPKRLEKISNDSDQTLALDEETRKDKFLLEVEDGITGQFNSKEKQLVMRNARNTVNLKTFPDSYLNMTYSVFFYQYCCMKEEDALNESDIRAFEYVFHQPAFEDRYQENLQWWEDGTLDDKLEKYAEEWGVKKNDGEEGKVEVSDNKGEDIDSGHITKTKKRWRLQRYLIRPIESSKDGLKHCEGIKESITRCGDNALTKFINGIARIGYIDNDPITKNSFAYALTGKAGFKKEIITVKWHHSKEKKGIPDSVRVLLYISKHMFDNTTGETYTQLFDALDAGPNPCIKDGVDQSPAYADSVNDQFKEFFHKCFGKKGTNQ